MYSILFGGAGILSSDAESFVKNVAEAKGIQALQKTTDTQTATYRIDAEDWPEGVARDWNALAKFLTT